MELNEKIARELDTTNKLVAKPNNCMLEQRPPEEKIIENIFGRSEYKYNLVIKGTFKPLLYKDRNFNLYLSLVDNDRKVVPNSNFANLFRQ